MMEISEEELPLERKRNTFKLSRWHKSDGRCSKDRL